MPRIDVRTTVDQATLTEILALIDDVTGIEGQRPVGEHKYAHLLRGREDWVGLLAYADGQLAGYVHTRWNAPGARPRMAAEIVVHPERGGTDTERQLLAEARRVLARAGGGSLYLWLHRVADVAATTPARMGFAVQRELAFMTRPLTERPPQPPAPAGIEVRAYRPGVDDDALLEVNNAAFAGHPENGGWDAATLAERTSLDWFDADDLLMAWQGDRAVGFHWTKWHGHDSDEVPAHEPVGEVYVLAVHPDHGGQGLGRYLLRAGLAHLHERGCRVAALYVDCASAAAVGLYTAEGFTVESREVCYEDDVPADPGAVSSDLLRPA
jgi:mycothiol synthase